ncbi:acyl-CoA reductase [Streptacidiphilus monticola]|uniref:Acyl-CoA reductase n=1 Tax=Streptacidiphilus monticola TaxID=2161674 RepID=A0ABW1GAW1_9ACTN
MSSETTSKHLWQGEWIDDEEAGRRLARLDDLAADVLAGPPLPTAGVLAACAALAAELADPAHPLTAELRLALTEGEGVPAAEAEEILADLASLLRRPALEQVLRAQLGTTEPALPRPVPDVPGAREHWAPVGLVAHVLPGNVATAAPWSVVEGLLTGNLNVAKASGGGRFLLRLLDALGAHDPSGAVARHTVALTFPSRNGAWLDAVCRAADSVVVWGGEEAVASVAGRLLPGTRLVDWGPKLSFAYLTREGWTDPDALAGLARDVCRHDQRACTSPQTAFVDTDDPGELFEAAERIAEALAKEVQDRPDPVLDRQQQAEVTTTVEVARLEQYLGVSRVLRDPDRRWCVLAHTASELTASPLHRTLWVRPLPRSAAAAVLRPARRYLQTVGLAAGAADAAELTARFVAAGAVRVTRTGAMNDSYVGEPHDGVFALQRHTRRVTTQR